jgi:hypothetical protein
MKKVILLILLSISAAVNTLAQEIDSLQTKSPNDRIDELSAKLDDLQNDYDYLSLHFELTTYTLELKNHLNTIDIQIEKINTLIRTSTYDSEIYTSLKENYDLDIELLDSMKELIYMQLYIADMKIKSSNFSNEQIRTLENEIDFCNEYIPFIEKKLSNYQSLIELYRKMRLY